MKYSPKVIIPILIVVIIILLVLKKTSIIGSFSESSDRKKENLFGIYEQDAKYPYRYYLYPDSTYLFVKHEVKFVHSEFDEMKVIPKYDVSKPQDEGNYTIIKQENFNVLRFKDKNLGIVNRFKLNDNNKSFYNNNMGVGGYTSAGTFKKIGSERDLPVRK